MLRRPTRKGGIVFIRGRDDAGPLVETFTTLARDVFAEIRLELKKRIPGLA